MELGKLKHGGKLNLICHLVWFGLVWFARRLVRGDGCNLAIERSLSTSILQELKNKFSFFPCQARKPYNHKAFPRFHAREIIGKNFAACVNFQRRSAGKQREQSPGGTYQEINPSEKPKRKGLGKGMDWKGRERKERK